MSDIDYDDDADLDVDGSDSWPTVYGILGLLFVGLFTLLVLTLPRPTHASTSDDHPFVDSVYLQAGLDGLAAPPRTENADGSES